MTGLRRSPSPSAAALSACEVLSFEIPLNTTFEVLQNFKFGRFASGRRLIVCRWPLLGPIFLYIRRRDLRRLYSSLPGGLPSAGLLLLRAAVGGRFLLGAFRWIAEAQQMDVVMWTLVLLALFVGFSFLAGFLTRVFSVLATLAAAAILLWHPVWDHSIASLLSFDLMVMAAALSLLGPGAFSLDARLFGLRKIIIPRSTSSQSSPSL